MPNMSAPPPPPFPTPLQKSYYEDYGRYEKELVGQDIVDIDRIQQDRRIRQLEYQVQRLQDIIYNELGIRDKIENKHF